ncbi:MAG: AAA family ATPase [Sulfurovum sp.]|nr:AAA family ATPase [Sulfurovum sp.]
MGIKPFLDYKTGEEKFTVDKTKKNKESTAILMVDESSMVGIDLYEYILEAIEEGRVGMVLFISDEHQLLPVGCISNKIYTLPLKYELTDIVRQAKKSGIKQIASALRRCIKTKKYMDIHKLLAEYKDSFSDIEYFYNTDMFLGNFHANTYWYEDDKILATHVNKNVHAINKIIRKQYWHELGKSNIPFLLSGDTLRFNQAIVLEM